MFYTELLHIVVLHCGNSIGPILAPVTIRPNNLRIQTLPLLAGDTLAIQIWTSYVKAFKGYHMTDMHTDTTKIIYHTTSQYSKQQ